MKTSTMNISLPDSLREYVKDRVEEEGYGTTSDFVRTLIQEDRKRRAGEVLEQLMLEGMNSGIETMTPRKWQKFRQSVHTAIDERTRNKKK